MKKLYAKKLILSLLCASLSLAALADGIAASGFRFVSIQQSLTDSLSTFSKTILSEKKSTIGLKMTDPRRPFSISKFLYTTKNIPAPVSTSNKSIMFADGADDRSVSDVKIFPNPTNDDLTISYNLKKDNNVTIKLMDLLGNEVLTIMPQQRVGAGPQAKKYNLSNTLSKGYYFIRVIVGGESVTKRISVL